MFFLGGNFVSSLIWTLKSKKNLKNLKKPKKNKKRFLKNLVFFPALATMELTADATTFIVGGPAATESTKTQSIDVFTRVSAGTSLVQRN